ncbi:MAG TPA: ZIP family metal transporter [Candidatus Dormibacteraeota bacterium]|jgi:ZIP family zinc transporter|nr:ZIP family metal transporter [Candidatus Dormibacteraeota bacterium]
MSQGTTVLLGAIAGLTLLLGLPVARLRKLSLRAQGFINALATGILIFLVWDVLTKAGEPVHSALNALKAGDSQDFLVLGGLFVGGLAAGLLSLVYANRSMTRRYHARKARLSEGPGALVAAQAPPITMATSGRWLAMMIAIGLGLHNFSEGLAIGASAASGAIAFATVLLIGFGLHNVTEGFGIAAPMAADDRAPSWLFLLAAGLVGGGPTFIGTAIGYNFSNRYVFVLFLALAAGALIYVISEMIAVGRRMNSQVALAWGLLLGFLAGYGTDLLLSWAGG